MRINQLKDALEQVEKRWGLKVLLRVATQVEGDVGLVKNRVGNLIVMTDKNEIAGYIDLFDGSIHEVEYSFGDLSNSTGNNA